MIENKKQSENTYKIDDETLKLVSEHLKNREPIYKGCTNKECFVLENVQKLLDIKIKIQQKNF